MAAGGRRNADAQLVAALAAGKTVEEAAARAGVSVRTVFRRLQEPAFQDAVTEARDDLVERAVADATAAMGEAVQTLRALLDPKHAATARLGAARALLELTLKLRDASELAQRLTQLERAFALVLDAKEANSYGRGATQWG